MKYSIGDIVKYKNNLDSYIVVATIEQPLTNDFLATKEGTFRIDKVILLANAGITVPTGFSYRLLKISHFQDGIAITNEKFYDVFEDEVFR